jgi:hypothetical protein
MDAGEIAPFSKGPSPLDLIEARDLSRVVAAAVDSLPQEQREVVVLKEYQGLTFLEIAEALEIPISTVKTRLYRGLSLLRQRFGAPGDPRRCAGAGTDAVTQGPGGRGGDVMECEGFRDDQLDVSTASRRRHREARERAPRPVRGAAARRWRRCAGCGAT